MRIAAALLLATFATSAHADSFEDYTSVHLRKAAASNEYAAAKKRITREDLVTASETLPKVSGVMLIVHTNDNRWAKLLVHAAAQKFDKEQSAPIALIERFVTYKEGEERAKVAEGKNVRLFDEFRFNLDIGAIVPEKFAADLRFVVDKNNSYLEPVGKAELFLLTRHLDDAAPPKGEKVVVGAKFEKTLFAGDYKLFDDGRKTGDLHLKVTPKGEVTGWMFSTATGTKYDVQGMVGPNPAHGIQFTIALPRTVQQFTGWMFTGNAATITGYSSIEGREAGFYAVRVE